MSRCLCGEHIAECMMVTPLCGITLEQPSVEESGQDSE